jgi:hypothetical protein
MIASISYRKKMRIFKFFKKLISWAIV